MNEGNQGVAPSSRGRSAAPSGLSPEDGSQAEPAATNASRVSSKLRFMAHVGDMGRKPDPDDIRRIAAAMIDEYDSSLRKAIWNLFKGKGYTDDGAIAAVEFELGRIARYAITAAAGTAKTPKAAEGEARQSGSRSEIARKPVA